MNAWIIFWAVIIIFSVLSFSYMSIQVLYKGLDELRYMFKRLDDEAANNAAAKKSKES